MLQKLTSVTFTDYSRNRSTPDGADETKVPRACAAASKFNINAPEFVLGSQSSDRNSSYPGIDVVQQQSNPFYIKSVPQFDASLSHQMSAQMPSLSNYSTYVPNKPSEHWSRCD